MWRRLSEVPILFVGKNEEEFNFLSSFRTQILGSRLNLSVLRCAKWMILFCRFRLSILLKDLSFMRKSPMSCITQKFHLTPGNKDQKDSDFFIFIKETWRQAVQGLCGSSTMSSTAQGPSIFLSTIPVASTINMVSWSLRAAGAPASVSTFQGSRRKEAGQKRT